MERSCDAGKTKRLDLEMAWILEMFPPELSIGRVDFKNSIFVLMFLVSKMQSLLKLDLFLAWRVNSWKMKHGTTPHLCHVLIVRFTLIQFLHISFHQGHLQECAAHVFEGVNENTDFTNVPLAFFNICTQGGVKLGQDIYQKLNQNISEEKL